MSVNPGGSAGGSGAATPGSSRRPSQWSHQLQQMLSQGRRNSAAKIISRIRSGSLPGWAGGGPIFPSSRKATTFAPDVEDGDDDENDSTGQKNNKKKRRPEIDPETARQQGNASMGSVVSALYAKLLVVMGCGFPLAEVISSYIPQSYYDGFYLYLYFVSILFMSWIFANVIQEKASREIHKGVTSLKTRLHQHQLPSSKPSPDLVKRDPELGGQGDARQSGSDISDEEEGPSNSDEAEGHDMLTPLPPSSSSTGSMHHITSHYQQHASPKHHPRQHHLAHHTIQIQPQGRRDHHLSETDSILDEKFDPTSGGQRIHFGNFYLRIGAVAFGIGSMIYSGLEFGQYFELEADTKCHNYMVAVTPCVRMIFTFMQMYFIFLNSRMAVSKVSLAKQFGLMHLIGTNLCVWLNVLIQETKHEIVHFYDPENRTITLKHGINQDYLKPLGNLFGITQNPSRGLYEDGVSEDWESGAAGHVTEDSLASNVTEHVLHRVPRGLKGPHSMYDCGRVNIIGSLVDSASPFLFPCTIEYSLICAAVCYVMWRSMAQRRVAAISMKRSMTTESLIFIPAKGEVRSPHHYTVDCAGSNKGFFLGIFFLVVTIMSLILNFVFMKHDDHMEQATFIINVTEVILYSLSTLAVLLGICRFRQLRYVSGKNLELDNILLIVAQCGSFVFNVFCIIGGHLTVIDNDGLVLFIPIICLIQLSLQTLFILDASKRVAATAEQRRIKPGREIITFLLVSNLAMWLINALEKSRGNSHPYLLHFYGVWAWTIITRISMPLAIFYRFHSTVCLCEIWKKAYKVKTQHH
ncbi:proton channel OtopLc [Folsomia candida]|uniref:proton channel OtopLc n=1 Tax=Folsomia candida TaxID=158441 RepID=UPI000B8FAE9F|nr:proton channel OtopLc [Folsomia candida]